MPVVTLTLPHHRYDIVIEAGALDAVGHRVRDRAPHDRAAVILDEAVEHTHGRTAAKALDAAGFDTAIAVMSPSEKKKTLGTVRNLYEVLLEHRLERRSPVVTVGGGITGDVGGFTAATYLRGVPWINCPTTLLAMVDASVGGKTGVNVPQGKNLIGAFHQPHLVVCDVATLETLPDRQLRCGLAECIKHAMIRDPGRLDWLEERLPGVLARDLPTLVELVEWNVRIKAAVVEADEREAGERAHLNFGHTFAHAIEATVGRGFASGGGGGRSTGSGGGRIEHGEAVALGMVAATGLAMDLGRVDGSLMRRLLGLLAAAGLPVYDKALPRTKTLLDAMRHDKKVADGKIRLVLPAGPGRVVVDDGVDETAIEAAWDGIRGVG